MEKYHDSSIRGIYRNNNGNGVSSMKRTVFMVLLSLIILPVITAQMPTDEQIEAGLRSINEHRAESGVGPVEFDPFLAWAAQIFNEAMISNGFGHDALPHKQVLSNLYDDNPNTYQYMHELIAMHSFDPLKYPEEDYENIASYYSYSSFHDPQLTMRTNNVVGFWITQDFANGKEYITVYTGRRDR